VRQLYTLTQKFWFYLKLVVETPSPNQQDISIPGSIVEELLNAKFTGIFMPKNLTCDIEAAKLAVNNDLAEWLFTELLDYMLDQHQQTDLLKIHGQVVDDAFHFSLSNCQEDHQATSSSEIIELIQFKSSADENSELSIVLKIVKKIVEIYDGVFLISGVANADTVTKNRNDISIYITLPLAAAVTSPTDTKLVSYSRSSPL
jgi:two-component system cell cycle response regulator